VIRIVGAGMAGLLAAHILRRQDPVILEAQPALPDNHGALLRFRTDAVARATGIPFQRVTVTKAVKRGTIIQPYATLRDHNEYSLKVTGAVAARSILSLDTVERYIAPDDFVEQLAHDLPIQFNTPLTGLDFLNGLSSVTTVSTIPMPALMRMVEWPDQPVFPSMPVWSVTMVLAGATPVNVHQTIYYPSLDDLCRYYRASITGNRLILEYTTAPSEAMIQADLEDVLNDFGLLQAYSARWSQWEVKHHHYGKILPIDDDTARRAFIVAMSDRHKVYSLGRFATWRQLLLDDVLNDIHVIHRFITERAAAYTRRLHTVT